MNRSLLIAAALASTCSLGAGAELVARFDMEVRGGNIRETVSGEEFAVEGNFAPENVEGVDGKALRFDGYTSKIKARLGDIFKSEPRKMTVSLRVAVPCYPIIRIDTETAEQTPIASCLDTESKTGFGFFIGFDGRYSFRTYVGGWPVNIEVSTPLPTYSWNCLTAVVDADARTVKLYNNGTEVGSAKANSAISFKASDFYMGQGTESNMSGPFQLMSYNGLIDEVSIWDEAKSVSEIQSWNSDAAPDLNIPASRFADDLLRPHFHGMPAAGWTNECHGMYFADGRYHLFFQKNADGPYMARLHWGHISSSNLFDWREERIALAPGAPYDIKGCWSGCVFSDEVITGGKPDIIYTAVDYVKASIALASPLTSDLNVWEKYAGNPIIGGKPSGLSDDFRDPYFFRHDDNAYIIVGSSKNGIGTTTLHRYNPVSGMWSNTGESFFSGSSKAQDGRFWEMPNVTRMANGKWLFTATPLETSQGVHTLYWTGSISADGTFLPDANSSTPKLVELNSKEGFGLLSPTVYNHDGKTIVLGIVPDKLPSTTNWRLGWAHCYSLPREWSLDDNGELIQRPFSGLTDMRSETTFSKSDFTIDSTVDLAPVSGRALELLGRFTVGNATVGFNIFKDASGQASISYIPATGTIEIDFSALPRLINDAGVYDGLYSCPLPKPIAAGEELKLNVFVDGSILDIFVNDRWATSIRVFPTGADANGVEAFAKGGTASVKSLEAWTLSAKDMNAVAAIADEAADRPTNVYTLQGAPVKLGVALSEATTDLPKGIYIVGNRKVVVK